MSKTRNQRRTLLSVTNFIHCGSEYLFIHRTKKSKAVDYGRLNGVGGKVEPGENFLECAIRETKEETGYSVSEQDCQLKAVVNLTGGYQEDWLVCFFSIEVQTKKIPVGTENSEGRLLWLPADKVLTSGYELVDDLNYLWQDIVEYPGVLFFAARLNEQEKITQHSLFHL